MLYILHNYIMCATLQLEMVKVCCFFNPCVQNWTVTSQFKMPLIKTNIGFHFSIASFTDLHYVEFFSFPFHN